MATKNQQITFKGEPIEVTGQCLEAGSPLPDFRLTGADLGDVTRADFQGKTVIISVVPSLDTAVCSMQTRRFNIEASKLGSSIAILTVSRDLPFAQKRWCGAEGASAVQVASDYKYRTFGQQFGVEIPALGLLARAVFVADQKGVVQYAEYVSEVAQEPDYDAALAVAKRGN